MTQKHIYDKEFRYTKAEHMDPLYLWRKFGFDKKPPASQKENKNG